MGKIELLSEEVANKIAAGEVIERPASVVKELVENSIDAGSTRIKVKVEDGGKKLIQVLDNGEGMVAEDAKLAFERHATSKVKEANDLFALRTLGFRGEALSSIAAVSRLKLTTKREDSLSGIKLRLVGGEIEKEESCGCQVGTNILVKDLFFNTPVRYKYLRQTSTEIGHISDIINRLSLAYPAISFRLEHNGRQILETTGNGNLLDVIFNIYGREAAKDMLEVDYQQDYMELTGFIAKPTTTRSSRKHQSYFVNDRFIKSGLMSKAVEEAYHTLLTINRHPIVVLKLKLNPILVDVNVHPTKLEAKFSRGNIVYKVVKEAVTKAIKNSDLIPKIELEEKSKQKDEVKKGSKKQDYQQKNLNLTTGSKQTEKKKKNESKSKQMPKYTQQTKQDSKEVRAKKIERLFGGVEDSKVDQVQEESRQYNEEDLSLVPIGQIHQSYIIAQGLDGMYIIDQHAAHERVIYQQLLQKYKEEQVKIQELLLPLKLDLTHQEAQLLAEKEEQLANCGFLLEEFGGNSYLIQGVPVQLYKLDDQELILDTIYKLIKELDFKEEHHFAKKVLVMISCKAAIKAKTKLSVKEMSSLLADIEGYQVQTCPHGRPVMMHLSRRELEKKFKRR
ncbi:DNA mismatch repair endonuclease MutL [Natroniella acetigena]|uniref:DNA mismatch repair endonuclease MutL n=1 Tax=Natroniella acetigena TaxID=52004 RepID=UPI00200AD435|nr:DNA mismatch repair endonuclease MutL [Natroniella acetigena]